MGLKRSKATNRAMSDSGLQFVGGVLVQDWGKGSGNKSAAIKKRVKSQAASNHTILILHETNNETVKALPGILDWYHSRGYKVVTVSKLKSSK
jgi:peptidoglycan/xylan/chitin deacetylase (PgdA/CDA1 family)